MSRTNRTVVRTCVVSSGTNRTCSRNLLILNNQNSIRSSSCTSSRRWYSVFFKSSRTGSASSSSMKPKPSRYSSIIKYSSAVAVGVTSTLFFSSDVGKQVTDYFKSVIFSNRVVYNDSHIEVSRGNGSYNQFNLHDQEFTFLKNVSSDLEITGESDDPLQIKVGTSLYDNPIDTLIRKINRSKYSVQAVVYKFDSDQIYASLSDALSRGVKVQLICDSKENKKPKSKAYKLRAEGALVEFWDYNRLKKLHAKFTIVDSDYVLSGSSNWTRNADNDNMELVLEFNGNVKEFSHTFEDMWHLAGGGPIGVF